jgi:hypothetical protein
METIERIGNVFSRVVILLIFTIMPVASTPLAERTGYAWAVLPAALISTLPFAAIGAGIDLMLIRPRQAWRFSFLGPLFRTTNDFFALLFMVAIAVGIGSLFNNLLHLGAAITFAIYSLVAGASGLVWQYAIQRFIDKRLNTVELK